MHVFLSYARKDATELAERLLAELPVDVWLDRYRIAGGAPWAREIEEAIDRSDLLLALITPAALGSEMCRAEHCRALRKGKPVLPILATGVSDIPLYLETLNWRRYPEQRAELLADIAGGHGYTTLKPDYRSIRHDTVPDLPQNHVPRPDTIARIRDLIFSEPEGHNIAVTALAGMGGIGKTVLASALCRDEVVQLAYPDGIAWLTVGREATAGHDVRMRALARALGEELDASDDPVECENRYRRMLRDKAALVVIDDVWNLQDVERLLVASTPSRFLFTTRDFGIARATAAREYRADLLEPAQAQDLFAKWAGRLAPGVSDEIIRECGRLPLALSMVGATLRGTDDGEWRDFLGLLRTADIRTIETRLPPGQDSFFHALQVSLDRLEPRTRECYKALAVLLEDMSVPPIILASLWNVSEAEARHLSRVYVDRSLAQPVEGGITLHDLQFDYVRALHPDRAALDLIHGAIRLSSSAFEKDQAQFASQAVGRLLPYVDNPTIAALANSLRPPVPWLRPLHPGLHPPGTALVRTMTAHWGGVRAVALLPDGRRAVGALSDMTLRVWDVDTGRTLRTLEGHSGSATGVAVSPDGARILSSSADGTLKLWDVGSGRVLQTFTGHSASVTSFAVLKDWRRAISASWDDSLKLWDLETGICLGTMNGHGFNDVAVTPDERCVVSASDDTTLRIWDLETGEVLRTLEGHSDEVNCVVVAQDGGRAISSSHDGTVKVWDLRDGSVLRTLEGHSGRVWCVALSRDGRKAFSGSDDKTVKVWDVETGRLLRTLDGHSSMVWDVIPLPDTRRLLSASDDGSLKLWDLEARLSPLVVDGHSNWVCAVAVAPGGARAVSASDDCTLKLWDMASGRVVRSLDGHSRPVKGVAVSLDGSRAISGSDDGTLKLWDLDTGKEVQTLLGHSDAVSAVAATADWRWALSASTDRTIRVWDLERGGPSRTLGSHSDQVMALSATSDGRRAISSAGNTVTGWDVQAGRALWSIEDRSSSVSAMAITPDGRLAVITGPSETLLILDLETGRKLKTLTGHSGWIWDVAASPDGRRVASASWDRTLRIWDLDTGEPVATFTCDAYALSCVFADDTLIVAGDAASRVHFLRLELM